jgi:hypothetical protein
MKVPDCEYRIKISLKTIFVLSFIFFAFFCTLNVIYCQTYEKTESELLKKMPEEVLIKIAQSGQPNENGYIGRNKNGWIHVAYQRQAMFYLKIAVLLRNKSRIDDAWRAIDTAFALQTAEGNFTFGSYNGKKPSRVDDLSGVSFWISNLCSALLVLKDNDTKGIYSKKIKKLILKKEKAVR